MLLDEGAARRDPEPAPPFGRALRWIIAGLLVGVVAFDLGCLALYRHLWQTRQAETAIEAQRVLGSFRATASRTLDYVDGVLRAARAYRAEVGDGVKWERFVASLRVPDVAAFESRMVMIDRQGRAVWRSGVAPGAESADGSLADADHFRYFQDHPGDGIFIGATRPGLHTGKLQFRCARPLFDRHGAFDGEIIVALRPRHLIDFYDSAVLGPHSSVTVLTLDGQLIARQPQVPPEVYRQRVGDLKASYGIDLRAPGVNHIGGIGSPFERGSRRDVWYQRLPDYPVVVLVGVDERDIALRLADARLGLSALAAVVTVGGLLLALLLGRQQRQRRRLEVLVREQRATATELRIAAAAFDSQQSMMITDAAGTVLRVNRAFSESTGFAPREIVGQTPRLLRSGRHDAAFYRQMWSQLRATGFWQGEIWDRRKDGGDYPKWLTISAVKDGDGKVTHYVGTHLDLSERKRAEERIQELAFFDQLTGLPNRALLLERLQQAMQASARQRSHGALLFIDLDDFKTLNDSLGHDIGDRLLEQAAVRLERAVGSAGSAARLGGDEFVVLLVELGPDVAKAANRAESVAERIHAALREPYVLDGRECHSTPSIGATVFLGNDTPRDELLKQADLAMYRAKSAGRNAIRFFAPDMQERVSARAALEADLRAATRDGGLLLHYQPQVDAAGLCTGAEALLRWQHPTQGMVPPDRFIRLAEETGLILPIGRWVLETACAQLAAWRTSQRFAGLSLAINVSGLQLHQPDFVEQVLDALARHGADAQMLKLELTESQLLDETEETVAKMLRLRAAGVKFALDDFGTGYSSLSYLKRLPLEKLKIDRSFVQDLQTDANAAAIARTIIALADALGLSTLAEGVETEAQRDMLLQHGCRRYQGYLFSRPLPLADFEAYAREHAPAR